MEGLVRHVLGPVLSAPDDLQVQAHEGRSATVFEIIVSDDDKDFLADDEEYTLRCARTVLSAAAGKRKATIEVVDAFTVVDDDDDDDDDYDDDADDDDDDDDDTDDVDEAETASDDEA